MKKDVGVYIRQGLLHLNMMLINKLLYNALIKKTENPDNVQAETLKRILTNNKNTLLGMDYKFSRITSVEDFINTIPVMDYEEFRPYIDWQIETGESSIVHNQPVIYAMTSGTTSKPKYIPVLPVTISSYKRAQRISSYLQYCTIPNIFKGKILAIVSPAIEGYLDNGTPYGSMSGLVYENMPKVVSSQYVLPPVIFSISDYEHKYQLIAAFALGEANISCIATANPSTLNKLSSVFEEHFDSLIKFVETGNINALNIPLNAKQKIELAPYCKSNPERAVVLRKRKSQVGQLHFYDLWDELKAIVTWTSGNCSLLIPKLRKQILKETKIVEMGYLSSEFRGTITIDCDNNFGLPTLQDNFFEFAEVDYWDRGGKCTLLLSQLEKGKKYYIIVTAEQGLYRYFINDIIEVTGYFKNTPTISFVQKGKGVTNLTGEKLYESQVIQAVNAATVVNKIAPVFFIMLADQKSFTYKLYMECEDNFDSTNLSSEINIYLSELNLEYLAKTQSGRINFVGIKRLKTGTYEAYKVFCIESGQREGQFKVVKLQYTNDVLFPFEEHELS